MRIINPQWVGLAGLWRIIRYFYIYQILWKFPCRFTLEPAVSISTVSQKGHLETISIDHGSKNTTTSSLHEHKYKLYLYIHTLSYLLLYRMNWRIETEIDYFIVMKPLQAMETSQIFREIERLKQNTCAHVHWLRANH